MKDTNAFKQNMALDTNAHVEKKGDARKFAYLSWAAAYGLAGLPEFSIPMFNGMPFRTMLGGSVVAVDMDGQRMWLPVLNHRNEPVATVDSRDVTDAHQRCLVKALAICTGVGLSLYAGYDGAGARMAALLPINEGDDLAKANPVMEKKSEAEYVPWWAGLAACKLADPEFHWEVAEFPAGNPDMPEATNPYLRSGIGILVAVDVTYKSRTHRQWLPVMDARFNSRTDASVMDWNTAVMRALAKGIAVVSGYGLGVYSGEDTSSGKDDGQAKQGSSAKKAAPASKPAAAPPAPAVDGIPAVQAKTVAAILAKLANGVDVKEVTSYLNSAASSRLGAEARKVIEDKIAELGASPDAVTV